eukprot:gb/GEZN01007454.1/.p1 GENE.gb/GEZN01007454.1/~~gb/GEZN01007454.1/.p1  ORF type:complete len:388 (-),score=36.45 gb/GEZN01007454.1/:371-1375(-)
MMKGKMTPTVPPDLKPSPRPAGEIFFTLPSGAQMPASGIGMCCRGTAYDAESVRQTTLWYLLKGGRLIDTAALYLNHVPIAWGIKQAVARGVPRNEIFVTTKVPPNLYGFKGTSALIERMLKELDSDYIDLVLLHMPFGMLGIALGEEAYFKRFDDCKTMVECWEGSWRALAAVRKQGKVRDVGVSNFNKDHLKMLQGLAVVKEAPIVINQLAYNPWVPQFQKDIVEYCKSQGIALTGYSTLGGSFGKDTAGAAEVLQEIATAHQVSTFLVLSRWSIQKGVAVIPGTGNPKHMVSNLAVYSFELSDAEMARIDAFTPESSEAPPFFSFSEPKTK